MTVAATGGDSVGLQPTVVGDWGWQWLVPGSGRWRVTGGGQQWGGGGDGGGDGQASFGTVKKFSLKTEPKVSENGEQKEESVRRREADAEGFRMLRAPNPIQVPILLLAPCVRFDRPRSFLLQSRGGGRLLPSKSTPQATTSVSTQTAKTAVQCSLDSKFTLQNALDSSGDVGDIEDSRMEAVGSFQTVLGRLWSALDSKEGFQSDLDSSGDFRGGLDSNLGAWIVA
ncbi:hypothetical protein MA16_Dca018505 [Dendrobium catenatum]|uniref:Uncharacterized protein n=1 Tax=Dendrobium catenatum TaxID=906689 RepID=A0A2I0VAE6_9ASPA|nr:hypothetical protein MA16_Dca018505 [Dendrobium catenatum]